MNIDIFTTDYDTSLEDFLDDIVLHNRGLVGDSYQTAVLAAPDQDG